jgi:hypothetical protein
LFLILITIVALSIRFLRLALSSRAARSAEVLFLRKQLAFYQEHQVRPRQLADAARVELVFLSRWFDWKRALTIVQPETLIGWHRKGFTLFWRRKSRMGRPRLPEEIRQLIVRVVKEIQPSLGPGIPESKKNPPLCAECRRHELPEAFQIRTKDLLGGLHHEYWLEKVAAQNSDRISANHRPAFGM